MKGKLLTSAILASLLVGSNAFASLARMSVMGAVPTHTTSGASTVTTNVANGALWYDDDYNVFYNPALINDNKNYVVMQKGLEGGWFKSEFENFAYGVYVNRSTNAAAGTVAPGLTSRTQLNGRGGTSTQRPIDLFIGGDTGVKWGLHLAWAYNRDQSVATASRAEDEVSNRYWHIDLGAQVMGLEPFIGMTFASKYQAKVGALGPNEGVQDLNEFNVGARYKYEGWTPYVAYNRHREAGTPIGGAGAFASGNIRPTQLQVSVNTLAVGVGHDTKIADGVHLQKHVGFYYHNVSDDLITLTTDVNRNYKQYVLPINFNLEAEATSWLVLRAGASYDFWNERKQDRLTPVTASATTAAENKRTSQTGTTTVRVGSTFKFGKLHIDSAFGNGAAGAADLDSTTNVGFDSQTFALLSASYHW